tara:strand:+ start:718 stop:1872 length:1155 start_codon:yes stop_codon:yes gene_type:complete
MKKKVCLTITTRGNYAKLKSLIDSISQDPDLELQLAIGGMAVLTKYGRIFTQLENLDCTIRTINFVIEGETLSTMAKSSGVALLEFSTAFEELKPDIVFVIADRFECLPIAIAASYMNIPVAHVEGGEITGSIDESIRHAITKIAHVHFPSSDEAAERIEKMGEDRSSIFKVGSSSMDMLSRCDLDDIEKINEYIINWGSGPIFQVEKKNFITILQHPVTTEYQHNEKYMEETIKALNSFDIPKIWIMPNMDGGADFINKSIRKYRESEFSKKTHFFKALPIEYYGPLLKNTLCLIGNSSSGIREAAFLGTPTVNIGTRQQGRERGDNVIDVDNNANEIKEAINEQIKNRNYTPNYLYGNGQSAEKIIRVIKNLDISIQKRNSY